jgi:hypothetical protein
MGDVVNLKGYFNSRKNRKPWMLGVIQTCRHHNSVTHITIKGDNFEKTVEWSQGRLCMETFSAGKQVCFRERKTDGKCGLYPRLEVLTLKDEDVIARRSPVRTKAI